jgi:dihydropteridine reductase
MASEAKNALIYGGDGQLGKEIVSAYVSGGWTVVCADFRASEKAQHSVQLQGSCALGHAKQVKEALSSASIDKLDAIVCVAGGWAGGSIGDESIFESVAKMHSFNVNSSVASAHLAANYLRENSLLVLTGAQAALGPTAGMIGYGLSKVAVHHLIRSIVEPGAGLPDSAIVAGILPRCLDTAQNRAGMPDAKWSDWTPLAELACRLFAWGNDPSSRPDTGSLVQVLTDDGVTTYPRAVAFQ